MLDEQTGTLHTHAGTYLRAKGDAITERSSYAINPEKGSVVSTGNSGGASRFFLRADYDESDVPVPRKGAGDE